MESLPLDLFIFLCKDLSYISFKNLKNTSISYRRFFNIATFAKFTRFILNKLNYYINDVDDVDSIMMFQIINQYYGRGRISCHNEILIVDYQGNIKCQEGPSRCFPHSPKYHVRHIFGQQGKHLLSEL